MSRPGRWTATWLAVVIVGTAALTAAPSVEITHRARGLHPGEPLLLDVDPGGPASLVTATAFGTLIRFAADPTSDRWTALLGIDLEVEPGEHPVTVLVERSGQRAERVTYVLDVEPKEFPTRRLRVAPSFVNPPDDVIERIQREVALQQELFTTASPERLWRGGFRRPVPGESTSSFGRRSVFNGEARSPHSGTDFRAGTGTPIRAPNAGVVALAGNLYFSGNVVIIDHGWGLYSYFAHLSDIDVADGDLVAAGDVVGKVGATGRVTGAHLHWTVRLNNARVDPIALMDLLPAS